MLPILLLDFHPFNFFSENNVGGNQTRKQDNLDKHIILQLYLGTLVGLAKGVEVKPYNGATLTNTQVVLQFYPETLVVWSYEGVEVNHSKGQHFKTNTERVLQ